RFQALTIRRGFPPPFPASPPVGFIGWHYERIAMNPNDYYRMKSAEIKEADIRLVAAVMSEHVGEENLIRIEALCRRVSMDDRKVRIILEKLVTEYHLPVCAHSGKAGRWLARSFDEARQTQ